LLLPNTEGNYGLDVVYLDYRKAFDSVPHRRLIEKLKSFGISGKLLQWLDIFFFSDNAHSLELSNVVHGRCA